ncbi:MAG: glycoside hydrolase family 99-like domain-containing protein [Thermogutta sp.]
MSFVRFAPKTTFGGSTIGVILVVALFCGWRAGADESRIEWRFDGSGGLQGWAAGGHVQNLQVRDGLLEGETVGDDPILFSPTVEIAAAPLQYVEFRMKTTAGGAGQLFWTETLEGRFGGFSEEKVCRFDAFSDGEFHVYRVYPFWHAAKKIIRLRLDPPAAERFAIEWIRVAEQPLPGVSEKSAWRFPADAQDWLAWQDVEFTGTTADGLRLQATGKSPVLLSPMLAVPADENAYVCVRMAVNKGNAGRILAVSQGRFGMESLTFPLRPDGKMHSYHIEVDGMRTWAGQVIFLGVQPTDAADAVVRLESIEIADAPRGPAEIEVGFFGSTAGVNRVRRPIEVALLVRNLGSEPVRDLVATLKLPGDCRILGANEQGVDRLGNLLPRTVSWTVECDKAMDAEAEVELRSANHPTVVASTTVSFTDSPRVAPSDYIPPPQPVDCPYDIGVFYFPGWDSMSRWQPILGYPMRKPLLGWYDESDPECADWQIKWAVEHGIKFFMVDWYWCQGNRHLEHWLHNAYMKSRFRPYLQWAVMWANHNPPNTHSTEDWRQVTQYWIDNYFKMEEYYRIDGRPAVFIWAPGNIRNDVGGSEEAAKLYAMSQEMARQAGLPGIYFVAMSSHDSEAACRQLKAEGYEAFTSYHGFQIAAQNAGSQRFPFSEVVATSPEVWQQADARASGLLYMPIVDTGWDSQPWHGTSALVITDRTPEAFGALCREARRYAHQTGKRIIAIGPWNEWGEGSYIEPCAERGFRDLEELRRAFCPPGSWPPALVPADIGRGPYDLPPVPIRTRWDFDTDGDLQGWLPNSQIQARVEGGLLIGKTLGGDPILAGPAVRLEADSVAKIVIRMKSTRDDMGQLFWSTANSPQSEANSVRFQIVGDGQFREYILKVKDCRRWRGLITSLRLDPSTQSDVEFAIDDIRLGDAD